MHNIWFGGWYLAGLIIAAFSNILLLSFSSPVYQVEMLCDLYTGFDPSQLSCLSSLHVSVECNMLCMLYMPRLCSQVIIWV